MPYDGMRFFTVGKQHKARELDVIMKSHMITRVLRWFRKFTVRFRPIRKEIVSWINDRSYNRRGMCCSTIIQRTFFSCSFSNKGNQAAKNQLTLVREERAITFTM